MEHKSAPQPVTDLWIVNNGKHGAQIAQNLKGHNT